MRFDQIIQRIQEQTNIQDKAKAGKVLRAVLGTFGELVYRTEERQMAAQLPKELKEVFYEYQPRERDRGALANYPLEEFFNRVKARAGVTLQEARDFTAIVLTVLREAAPGKIDTIRTQVPERFHKLLDMKPPSRAPKIPKPPLAERADYHILKRDDRWLVTRGLRGEVLGAFETKDAAIGIADEIADRDRGDLLVIHNVNGSLSKREAPSRELKGKL